MPSTRRETRARHGASRPAAPVARLAMRRRAGVEAVAVMALVASVAIAPIAQADAQSLPQSVVQLEGQSLTVSSDVDSPATDRDDATATPGVDTLVASGTNADWASLVLLDGGWPTTESNITAILRWMRQENGTDNWWNRNNPLNNGYGSGGGGGTGTYENLQVAAQKAAENLQRDIFSGIAEQLAYGRSADKVAAAIWASAWSTSHYANGTHWSTAAVPIVTAPASAWG
ncbi:MAG: hypothetical protein QM635_10265 [Microbacteriaceae bacterium]